MNRHSAQVQRPYQDPANTSWYHSGSSSVGNRAVQGTLGAAGGALAGTMLAHGLGRNTGRGALLGAAAGAVGGFLGGHRVNRWVNQNPGQYNAMLNFTDKISAHLASEDLKTAAAKTVLAHYGLHKLATAPDSNVHQDVGTYRFNRTAESADIDDSKQYVFKAHDRKPQVTGNESAHAVPFLEGVSG